MGGGELLSEAGDAGGLAVTGPAHQRVGGAVEVVAEELEGGAGVLALGVLGELVPAGEAVFRGLEGVVGDRDVGVGGIAGGALVEVLAGVGALFGAGHVVPSGEVLLGDLEGAVGDLRGGAVDAAGAPSVAVGGEVDAAAAVVEGGAGLEGFVGAAAGPGAKEEVLAREVHADLGHELAGGGGGVSCTDAGIDGKAGARGLVEGGGGAGRVRGGGAVAIEAPQGETVLGGELAVGVGVVATFAEREDDAGRELENGALAPGDGKEGEPDRVALALAAVGDGGVIEVDEIAGLRRADALVRDAVELRPFGREAAEIGAVEGVDDEVGILPVKQSEGVADVLEAVRGGRVDGAGLVAELRDASGGIGRREVRIGTHDADAVLDGVEVDCGLGVGLAVSLIADDDDMVCAVGIGGTGTGEGLALGGGGLGGLLGALTPRCDGLLDAGEDLVGAAGRVGCPEVDDRDAAVAGDAEGLRGPAAVGAVGGPAHHDVDGGVAVGPEDLVGVAGLEAFHAVLKPVPVGVELGRDLVGAVGDFGGEAIVVGGAIVEPLLGEIDLLRAFDGVGAGLEGLVGAVCGTGAQGEAVEGEDLRGLVHDALDGYRRVA